MKRNRRIISIAVLLCLLVSLFAFTACSNEADYTKVDPTKDLFVGNIMQIVVKNLGEQPVSVGSGFVFNKEGWFITNSHVMEDAYYADAYFEIPNAEIGETVTRLKILQGAVNKPNKDIFIGKIDGYDKIASYYREFEFTTEYQSDDITFSIGYPNATPFMGIQRGSVISDVPYFPDKLNGVTYIDSTSSIAPGSSGGVLMNDKLQVIGLTTARIQVENAWYNASVATYNFINEIDAVPNFALYNLMELIHGDDKEYINLFEQIKYDNSYLSSVDKNGCVSFIKTNKGEGVNSDNIAYSFEETYLFDSDYYIQLSTDYYWAGGGRRQIRLYGYWNPVFGFSSFVYEFKYTYNSGRYYTVKSSKINYSENIELTLNNYVTDSSYSYTITDENIAYVKLQFNYIYETLMKVWESYGNTIK